MNVIVIGAGPSGLAVSLGLSNLGYTVDLLERYSTFEVKGSTLGLAPNGAQALAELCPSKDVCSLTDLGIPMSIGPHMLAWYNIRDWLLDQVQQDDKISLHTGLTLVSIDDDEKNDTVTVHCEHQDFTGHLVVGADGVHSRVRTLLGLSPAKPSGYLVWRGSVNADGDELLEPLLDEGFVPLGEDGYKKWGSGTFSIFNHHPRLPKRLNWVMTNSDVQPGTTTSPWDVIEAYVEPELAPIIQRLLEKSEPHEREKSYNMGTIELPFPSENKGWGGKGRITLIGDAAHALRPVSGLGTAMAFEDCAVLCRKLKNGDISSKDKCQKVIHEFEQERLERVKIISDEQGQTAEAISKGEKFMPWTDRYREWVYGGV